MLGLSGRFAQAGLTMVELLIVVSIIGVLAAVAVPNMSGLMADARLTSQTDLLIAALNGARLEAIKQRTAVSLCPAANANSDTACSVSSGDWSNGWLVVRADGTILQRLTSKSGLTMAPTIGTPVVVTFNATIGGAAAATSFTLCVSGRQQRTVSIAASGRIGKGFGSTTCT